MASVLSFRVSMVAMPMLTSPVATASNTHCSRGAEAPAGVQAVSTSSGAEVKRSEVNVGIH